MALSCCRYCGSPLPDGGQANRAGEFCSEDHRYRYQAKIHRETIERLRLSEQATVTPGNSLLHSGPPPGLMTAPALRGPAREPHANGAAESPAPSASQASPEAALAALSGAAHPATPPPGIGHIEKTDNASLSNLLREARNRIAKDPAPTSTALAVRRRSRPSPRPTAAKPAPGVNGSTQAANGNGTVPAGQPHSPKPATPAFAPAAPVASAPPSNLASGQDEVVRVVPVRVAVDLAIEPPRIDVPLRPQMQPSKGTASAPTAEPSYPSADTRPSKPSSDISIEITPPSLAMPAIGLMERIPWYAKLVVVLGLVGGGGYYYWATEQVASATTVRRQAIQEVEPLLTTPNEWVQAPATGEDAAKVGRVLTLHKTSMDLTNFRVEFVGTVDRRALGWAFRIQDPANYYAAKLRMNPSGSARISYIRWKVVNGVAGPQTILPLEMRLPSNDQYTIKLDVRGDEMVTTLQGKVIDRFTDSAFTKGGFAYTNENTERGKVLATTIGMLKASSAR